LKSSAENAKNSLQKVLSQIDGSDNSTALILQKNGEVSKQLDRISQDAEALISDVKKNGIKLNVDIF
jgi:phospholipid/cholesterol/gamma-HCH transport system substrate-binding protein